MNIQFKLDNKMIERSNIHSLRECNGPQTNITLDNKFYGKTILILIIK